MQTTDHDDLAALTLAGAAAAHGPVVTCNPKRCCGVLWSSRPSILDLPDGGWTRSGRCGKCGAALVDVVLSVPDRGAR